MKNFRRPPILVVSPHLDDAVFGCGDLLAAFPGSTVVTIFAGSPPVDTGAEPPRWDVSAGFGPGDHVATRRRSEDAAALRILRAVPRWLDFWDSQYERAESEERIRAAVEAEVSANWPAAVYFPVGLFHSDHRLTHRACFPLCDRPGIDWYLYEDAIYRRYTDFPPETRLNELRRAGFRCDAVDGRAEGACEDKRRAVACYASQLRALSGTPGHPGYGDVFLPERYYRLVAPAGRSALPALAGRHRP